MTDDSLSAIGPLSPTHAALNRFISQSLLFISGVASVLVLVGYLYLRLKFPVLADRVSLRLTVAISLTDLLLSVSQFLGAALMHDGFWCEATTFSFVFCTLMSVFLSDSIAYNLQLVFLQDGVVKWGEACYYLIPILLSLVMTVPGWIMGKYGWDDAEQTCWYRHAGTVEASLWMMLTFYLGVFVGICYCVVVVWRVCLKLVRVNRSLSDKNKRQTQRNSAHETSHKRRFEIETARVVACIVRYAAIPIASQSFTIIHEVAMFTTREPQQWLLLLSYVTWSLQGLMNFIAFCMDPSVTKVREGSFKQTAVELESMTSHKIVIYVSEGDEREPKEIEFPESAAADRIHRVL